MAASHESPSVEQLENYPPKPYSQTGFSDGNRSKMTTIAPLVLLLSVWIPGLGQKEDIEVIKARAEAGDVSAVMLLADAFDHGSGVEIDMVQAAYWYMKAAEAGNPEAQSIIGTKMRLGEGIRKDHKEAVSWYRKSAKQGNANAMFNLGTAYYNGEGEAINDSNALAWFIAAQAFGSDKAPDAVQRGFAELNRVKLADGLIKAAYMFVSGNEIPERPETAVEYLKKAMDAGRKDASIMLAELYLAGKGVPKDAKAAAEYCSQAAKSNYTRAYFCLGQLYRTGEGEPKDPAKAAFWYGKAARCGDIDGLYMMGRLYGRGEGVKKDRILQYAMLMLAHKIPEAQEEAAQIKAQLSDKDLRKAKKKAGAFVQKLDPRCVAPALLK